MEDLSTKPFAFQQRVEACRVLYFKYQGRHHDHIQREMRELGDATFNRRVFYGRNQRAEHALIAIATGGAKRNL